MNAFLVEIWSDMKDKRLWPVAALLALALLAVPFVLAKPADETASAVDPTATTPQTGSAAQVLPAELEAAKPLLQTSTLSEFASKDPFKPLRNLRTIEQAAGVETGGEAPSDTGGTAPEGGDGGGTGAPGGDSKPPATVEEEKTVFTYQAVVELGTASGSKTRKVNRLGILPNATNPLLVFLGVSAGNNNEAVFLVDSTVTQAGEGRCRPNATTCSFLYLTTEETNDEHIFTTDDGKEYSVKLLEIRRVKVESSRSAAPSPEAKAGATTTASFEDPTDNPFDGFGFPLFADEEE